MSDTWRDRLARRRTELSARARVAAISPEVLDAEAMAAAEDLPYGGRGSGAKVERWPQRLAPLMAEGARGRWRRVYLAPNVTTATSTAHLLRKGALKAPIGVWEFTTRGAEVWSRYIGPIDEVGQQAAGIAARGE